MVLEEALTSGTIWASIASWFTPTMLFVLINLVIGTIAVTSTTTKSKDSTTTSRDDQQHQPRLLSRGSSLLAQLRSINLHPFTTAEQQQHPPRRLLSRGYSITETVAPASSPVEEAHRTPSPSPPPEEDEEEEHSGFETLEEAYAGVFKRSQSDSHPVVEKTATATDALMKKSASTTTTTTREEERKEVEARRPKTVKEGRRKFTGKEEEEEEEEVMGGGGEVDARADDFINRFRKQLQLQRLDSLLRYKEMLNRGK